MSKGKMMRKSPIVIHPIRIAGHRTSISVEDAFWKGLKEIAADRNMTLSDLVTTINSKRKHNNLSSEIAPEPTGHGLPLGKCEAYNRVYDQSCGSS
jgi:fructose-1,6-bisphosphatase/sedoheptulose 1,7-bisphosphatase-like protein